MSSSNSESLGALLLPDTKRYIIIPLFTYRYKKGHYEVAASVPLLNFDVAKIDKFSILRKIFQEKIAKLIRLL